MTVRLKAPWAGLAIGQLYDGADQDWLLSVGKADGELGRGRMITSPATTHTLTSSDAFRERQFTSPTAVTVRIAANLQDMPFGILGTFRQTGAGVVSVVGDPGVTVTSASGFARSSGPGAVFQIEKIDAMTVALFGALALS